MPFSESAPTDMNDIQKSNKELAQLNKEEGDLQCAINAQKRDKMVQDYVHETCLIFPTTTIISFVALSISPPSIIVVPALIGGFGMFYVTEESQKSNLKTRFIALSAGFFNGIVFGCGLRVLKKQFFH